MIPFIVGLDENGNKIGIVYPKQNNEDINEWYDYDNNRYATAVITNENYDETTKGKNFQITDDHIVKIWIPKSIRFANLTDNLDFTNKSGVWVKAEWNEWGNNWQPVQTK